MILLGDGVFGLCQNADQALPVECLQRYNKRKAADKLRDQAKFQDIVRFDLL